MERTFVEKQIRQYERSAAAAIDAINNYKEEMASIQRRLDRLYDEVEANQQIAAQLRKLLGEG